MNPHAANSFCPVHLCLGRCSANLEGESIPLEFKEWAYQYTVNHIFNDHEVIPGSARTESEFLNTR